MARHGEVSAVNEQFRTLLRADTDVVADAVTGLHCYHRAHLDFRLHSVTASAGSSVHFLGIVALAQLFPHTICAISADDNELTLGLREPLPRGNSRRLDSPGSPRALSLRRNAR